MFTENFPRDRQQAQCSVHTFLVTVNTTGTSSFPSRPKELGAKKTLKDLVHPAPNLS